MKVLLVCKNNKCEGNKHTKAHIMNDFIIGSQYEFELTNEGYIYDCKAYYYCLHRGESTGDMYDLDLYFDFVIDKRVKKLNIIKKPE